MSARKTEPESAVRHPRDTVELFGHREAEMPPCSMPIAAGGFRMPG